MLTNAASETLILRPSPREYAAVGRAWPPRQSAIHRRRHFSGRPFSTHVRGSVGAERPGPVAQPVFKTGEVV